MLAKIINLPPNQTGLTRNKKQTQRTITSKHLLISTFYIIVMYELKQLGESCISQSIGNNLSKQQVLKYQHGHFFAIFPPTRVQVHA